MVRKCVIYTLVDGSRYDYESQETLPSLDSELYTLNSIANNQGTTFVYTTKDDLAYIQKVYLLYNRYLNQVITSKLPVFIVVAPSNIITIANLANTISLDEYMNTFNDEFSTLSSLSEDKLSNVRSLISSYQHTEHLQKEYSTLYNTIKTYYTSYNKYYRTLHASSPIIKDLILPNSGLNSLINLSLSLQQDTTCSKNVSVQLLLCNCIPSSKVTINVLLMRSIFILNKVFKKIRLFIVFIY